MRWMLQDGLQSVRAISDGMNVLSAQAYSPYGEPMYNDLPTEFGFTGEQTDPLNDLVYLRARVMNPKLGVFGSLDPFEGESSAPLTMNGYGWVEGNTPNLTDAGGKQTCLGETTSIQNACKDLSKTLSSFPNADYWNSSLSSIESNGLISIPTLEVNIENMTGTTLSAYNTVDLVNCSEVFEVKTDDIKHSLINWAASLVHTSDYLTRLGTNRDTMFSWLSGNTVGFLSELPNIIGAYTGYVQLNPPNNILNLGSYTSIATNSHEQGHDFDRFYGLRASAPLKGLYIDRYTRMPTYTSTQGTPQAVQNSNGLSSRAGLDDTQQEVWADMYMTTVGEGNNFLSGPNGETPVGWNYNYARDAKFKRAYTILTTNALLNGSHRFPPVNATQEENLAWVTWVARLAFNNPGNPGGDY